MLISGKNGERKKRDKKETSVREEGVKKAENSGRGREKQKGGGDYK